MLDKPYAVIDWELVDGAAIGLVKSMVAEAKRNGGRYSRKLIWFWREANRCWDEDEAALWVLNGDWHQLKMGQDLTEVF